MSSARVFLRLTVVLVMSAVLAGYAFWSVFIRDPRVTVLNESGQALRDIVLVSRAEWRRHADMPPGSTAEFSIRVRDSDPILFYYSACGVSRVADCGLMDKGETREVTIRPPGDRYIVSYGPLPEIQAMSPSATAIRAW